MTDILIVDDEPWSRQVVKALGEWERIGIRIVGEAEDGSEGMRRIEELNPHIVLTDMRMPGLDGIGLLREMNARFPRLKIIVMSGYDDFSYLKQAIQSNAVDYLLKPVDPDELNAALERCVRELAREQKAKHPAWTASIAFPDAESLERYADYRRQVYGHLLALNKSGVQEALGNLGIYIEELRTEVRDDGLLPKIRHDFLLMLEEFIAKNAPGLEWIGKGGEWPELGEDEQDAPHRAAADLSRFYSISIDAVVAWRKQRSRLDMSEVQSHLDRHYLDPISLETVAQQFFVSKEHLSRSFKAFCGETLSDYILRKRMEKAREMIVDQKMAIKNTAELAGYADLAYFYRVFKKHFGYTPGELRREE